MPTQPIGTTRLIKKPIRVTIGQAAELLGVHHQTVANWTRAGLPVVREGRSGMLDLAVMLPWVRARDRKELDDHKALVSPDAARTAKVAAEARLKEMDVAEREGKLLRADHVEERWTEIVVAVREAVMAVAGVAVQAGLIKPTQEAELETALRDALVLASGQDDGEDE